MEKRRVLFDFGGTIDTDGIHWFRFFMQSYAACGMTLSQELFRKAYVSVERSLESQNIISPDCTFRDMLSVKLELQRQGLEAEGMSSINPTLLLEECYKRVRSNIELVSRPALERLAGHVDLGLVSNFYGNMNTVLKEFGLDGLFREVTESATVGVRKPDTRIFLKAAEAAGVGPKCCVMVGDSLKNDILPASSTGMATVWLKGQGWETGKEETGAPVGTRVITTLGLPELRFLEDGSF